MFEKHPTTLIKWKTKVSDDDAHGVEHGVDVHYVGDEFEDSSGQKVRLWDGEMVSGGASSMDGENKGERRKSRHANLCARSTRGPRRRVTF